MHEFSRASDHYAPFNVGGGGCGSGSAMEGGGGGASMVGWGGGTQKLLIDICGRQDAKSTPKTTGPQFKLLKI